MRVGVSCGLALLWCVAATGRLPAQEAAAPVQPGAQAAEFERVFGEWKKLLADLAALQIKYRAADDDQRGAIQEQWDRSIKQGDGLQSELIAAAQKAYAEAPNKDQRISELLVDVLLGDVESRPSRVQTDDYERALPLGKLLVENQCPDKRACGAAGIAAFALADFDAAENLLRRAEKEKTLSRVGESFLESIAECKKAWAKEQELRQAEAKADDLPRVLLKTSKGDIELELFENEAPNTVANFVSLVEKEFYNGLMFHRVLPGFMAQGGCPDGTGAGGPGYQIPCECYRPDYRHHFRGSLSMAHAGRDTGGSQFFLTFIPTTHLDGKHTAFGRVVKGMEVLSKLQRRDPQSPDAPKPDKILEAKVLRKRNHPYEPKKL